MTKFNLNRASTFPQRLAFFAVLAISALFPAVGPVLSAYAQTVAQGIEGTWQGTLHVPDGPQLRIVVKIAKDDKGMLKSTFYSIDQGGAGIPADTTTLQGADVRMYIERLNLTYTGKLSADGNSITGESDQNGKLPLILERATASTEWTIPEPPKPVPAMDPKADPSFEVATIKPSKPDAPGKLFGVRAGKFSTVNFTLGEMISAAYGVQQKQVINAPEWVYTEKFDVQAQSDTPGSPNHNQLMSEVKKLLADRFQLKFHQDKKELPALLLSVAKGGPKLKLSTDPPGGLPSLFFTGFGVLTIRNATMDDFINLMQSAVLDRPIVDQTGLMDRYNFTLKWTPDEAQIAQMGMKAPAAEPADAPPNLFTAMQEELGLRLESGKSPVPVLVIDKVEKPSEN